MYYLGYRHNTAITAAPIRDGPLKAPSNDFQVLDLYMSTVTDPAGRECRLVPWDEHLKKSISFTIEKISVSQL